MFDLIHGFLDSHTTASLTWLLNIIIQYENAPDLGSGTASSCAVGGATCQVVAVCLPGPLSGLLVGQWGVLARGERRGEYEVRVFIPPSFLPVLPHLCN